MVTTLLSCRWLERIAIAKLQNNRIFSFDDLLQAVIPAKVVPRLKTIVVFIFSVTIQRRMRSNATIHSATANAINDEL